jgi:hypothetical protein
MLVFSIIVYAAFGIFFITCILSGIRKIKEIKTAQESPEYYADEKEHDEAIRQAEDFEKGYFERIRNGEQSQQFLSVGSQMICSFLRSLLAAENIPTYTENEHVNSMYSLNALSGNSAFSIKVFILIADYDRAYEIVSDYIASCEKTDDEHPSIKSVAKTAGAIMSGMFFVAAPSGSQEAVHGIMILPRVIG